MEIDFVVGSKVGKFIGRSDATWLVPPPLFWSPSIALTYSVTLVGVNAVEAEVESNNAGGNPRMMMVGLPGEAQKDFAGSWWNSIGEGGSGKAGL